MNLSKAICYDTKCNIRNKGHTYYAGLSTVAASEKGSIHIPAYLHSGYARNLIKGTCKKLPATIGLKMTGREASR